MGSQSELHTSAISLRRFLLERHEDPTGTSGVGIVAEGVLFSDGSVALRWHSGTPSTILYESIDDLLEVHGHQGRTSITWKDIW